MIVHVGVDDGGIRNSDERSHVEKTVLNVAHETGPFPYLTSSFASISYQDSYVSLK